MGVIFLMLKHKFLLLFLLSFSISSLNALTVVVAKKQIAYEEKITVNLVEVKRINTLNKNCVPVSLQNIKDNNYAAKHFINIGSVICKKNIQEAKNNSVTFKFGAIEIETPGKIIFENDEYIKIKKLDGSIDKIYKDGRLR